MTDENENIEETQEGEGEGLNPGIIVALVLIVAVVLSIVFSQKTKFMPVIPGTQSLEFSLPDLEGNEHSLSEYKGKVVFLNFWATWCKPCEDEMPSMQVMYEKMKDRGFVIVAVSMDKEEASVVKKFAKKYNLTFPILHDRLGKVKEMYKTTGVPETFILDQNGVVAEKIVGPRNWNSESNLSIILKLLNDGPSEDPQSYTGKKVETHQYKEYKY